MSEHPRRLDAPPVVVQVLRACRARRRAVRCWRCGCVRRRRPSLRGWSEWDQTDIADEGGLVIVGGCGKIPLIRIYGTCPAPEYPGADWPCGQPMLLPVDARRVLRAAIRWERRGGNRRSEYDG